MIWLAFAWWGCSTQAPHPAVATPPRAAPIAAVSSGPVHRPSVAFTSSLDGSFALAVDSHGPTARAIVATPLDEASTAALLARLEPLPVLDNAHPAVIRPASPQPASSGVHVPIAFVAPTGRAVADRPLAASAGDPPAPMQAPQILPSGGEAVLGAELRVRFTDAMVPIAQIKTAPVLAPTLDPPVVGAWRWNDTREIQFLPSRGHLPGSTKLTVTVAAGVRSLTNTMLEHAVSTTLTTPAVQLDGVYPRGVLRPDAAVVVRFTQDIDPVAIAKLLHLTANHVELPFDVITLDQAKQRWARQPHLELKFDSPATSSLVLAPKTAWPSDRTVVITLDKGAPSLEGPLVSKKPSVDQFVVAPKFELLGLSCDQQKPQLQPVCPAESWARLEMKTRIEPQTFRAELVQLVDRPFEDHSMYGSYVELGLLPIDVGKTFEIAIGDGLRDVFGQDYIGPHRIKLSTTRPHWHEYLYTDTGLYVLDPRYQVPQWSVIADAVPAMHVQLYAVQPADYFAFQRLENDPHRTAPIPGRRVFDHEYKVGLRSSGHARVDLRPSLGASGTGHVLAIATAGSQRDVAWIEVTKLGVVARLDGDQASAWASDISPAHFLAPVPGTHAQILIEHAAPTQPVAGDAGGHVSIALPGPALEPYAQQPDAVLAIATGTDSAFVPIDRARKTIRTRNADWYVTDDRFTYKPGEPLYIKGWMRWTHDGVNPGLELPKPSEHVEYKVSDARGVELGKGRTALTAQGGFDFQVALPATANLGEASVDIVVGDQIISHPFAIEEFRTPAYAVALDDDLLGAGALPLVLGESTEMRAEAHYYGGGGLDGANIEWAARLLPAAYRPVGFDGFSFALRRSSYHDLVNEAAASRLGAGSSSSVSIAIHALPNDSPSVLEVDATVTDLDRATIRASSHSIVVHPSALYVGVRVKPGTRDRVEAVAVDLDNHAVAGVPIDIDFTGVLGSEESRDDAHVKDAQHCHVTSATTPVTCTVNITDDKLVYYAAAHVVDARGRGNAAGVELPWWATREEHRQLDIAADKTSYRAGDVAKLTIFSDVAGHAVVSYTRNGLVAQRAIELEVPETKIAVPIDVSYLENVHVVVDRVARRLDMEQPQASKDPLPEHLQADIELAIDKRGAALDVTATPSQPAVGPGDPATFDVTVAHAGKPVAGAEVALMVVDEAVLALSGRHHDDPLEPFYRTVEDGTVAASSLELVRDAGIDVVAKPGYEVVDLDTGVLHGSGTGTGEGFGAGYGTLGHGAGGGGTAIIESRKDFRATALWAPRLITDRDGHARVTVKMPDSLTRYRVVALAASGTYYFGKVEDAIATRREVNARIVAPRFLTQGDSFELPVIVQNLDVHPRTIAVVARAANLVIDGGAGKQVTLPPGQRAEVRFAFHTQGRGRAAIQTALASGDRTDASVMQLPVYAPATTESFATYGIVDDAPAVERLDVPADIYPEVGGVEAELSSTQLQSLTDAYWYLQAYPYECAEQRSSRMLATAAMADVLAAFAVPDMPSKDELAAQHVKDVQKLVEDQLADGSWGYWPGSTSMPIVTMQVMQALAHEPAAAKAVAKARTNVGALARKLLASLDARADAHDRDRVAYEVAAAADALAALAAVGGNERALAQHLHATATRLGVYPLDAKARLLAIVAKQPAAAAMRSELVRAIEGASRETAAGAYVAEQFTMTSLASLLPSPSRTSALALDALIRESPKDPLIAKLARGLLGNQRGGRWRTTQENLVVLQAMRRYFDAYERVEPNFTGKLWLGGAAYAEHAFQGHTTERADAALGWDALAPGSSNDIAIAKAGAGRLYYRVGITYAPKLAKVDALDAGFVVRRVYEPIDDPNDVVKTQTGYTIRLGARVRVRLEAASTTPNDNVALVDPLPAGFEAVNTRLATSERTDDHVTREWRHVEMRDDRAEAFALELDAGTHQFEYTVRATTPGTFVAGPTKAEDMYAPETFGRTAAELVTIR
ncbi:MAG TPA: alpha-2-macroglobulin family protein [Kofleriaceae bacterium]